MNLHKIPREVIHPAFTEQQRQAIAAWNTEQNKKLSYDMSGILRWEDWSGEYHPLDITAWSREWGFLLENPIYGVPLRPEDVTFKDVVLK